MAGDPKPGLQNVLGITGLSGYMRNLGPGVVGLSRETRGNYHLGMANAGQRYRVNRDPYANENAPNSGRARIHYAAVHGDVGLLRNLVKHGADIEMTLNGKTPLVLAIENNKPEIVEELCNLGADVNRPMESGETALHMAVYYGNFRIVNLLLNCGADVTVGAGSKLTPLDNATMSGNEQMMDLLLKHGAKAVIDAKSMRLLGQQAAIHRAVGSGCLGCVKLLVQAGADINVQDRGGQTAIQAAESEYEMWENSYREYLENPRAKPESLEYKRERVEEARNILEFLREIASTGGRRHSKRHLKTRRRKTRNAHTSRKHI